MAEGSDAQVYDAHRPMKRLRGGMAEGNDTQASDAHRWQTNGSRSSGFSETPRYPLTR